MCVVLKGPQFRKLPTCGFMFQAFGCRVFILYLVFGGTVSPVLIGASWSTVTAEWQEWVLAKLGRILGVLLDLADLLSREFGFCMTRITRRSSARNSRKPTSRACFFKKATSSVKLAHAPRQVASSQAPDFQGRKRDSRRFYCARF